MRSSEKEVLRQLAATVAEHAHSQGNVDLRKLWIKHNDFQGERPMILLYPENSWHEILREEDLLCSDPFLRSIEFDLRSRIYHINQFHDDRVFDPVYYLPMVIDEAVGWNLGVCKRSSDNPNGAYIVEPTLKSEEDLQTMMATPHRWRFDDTETRRRCETLHELFGDLLPVRPYLPFYTGSIIFRLVDLRGLTNLMMDLIDQPDFLHRVMRFMTDETIANYKAIEAAGRATSNNCEVYLPSGSHGFTNSLPRPAATGPGGAATCRLKDVWGFADTQEFTDVSPEMWREFALPYQKEVLQLFGPIYYGCCEKLDEKFEDVLTIDNIRKISVSPWSDPAVAAEKIGDRAIYCRKPSPSNLIYNFDRSAIRQELQELLRITGGRNLEIVMKDLITCNSHPEYLAAWIEEARRCVDSV